MKPIRVLIVDDSALIRELFTELLSSDPEIRVVGTAADAMDAREKIKQLNPDVLTLDIEMPGMNGLDFLEKIMTLRPMPVIMASTLTQKGAGETIRALELGAVDYISKQSRPTQDAITPLKDELVSKIKAAAQANLMPRRMQKNLQAKKLNFKCKGSHLIAIGSSTGGVEALRDIFLDLPANSPPIVMAQHMPAMFTPSFAARLNNLSQMRVAEAVDGAWIEEGHAYLAPGSHHLKVIRKSGKLACRLDGGPLVSGHRPSVDVLFTSVAETAGTEAVGVILTGMGRDGAAGMLRMRQAGSYTIGQNQSSCVVYGMPRAAAALGAVHIELPLHEIAAQMLAACEQERRAVP